MKVSLDWVSDFVALPCHLDAGTIAHDLTLTTVEVEGYEEVDDDVVLEIDNKSLTNRPDLWGHYGIAREFAAIYDVPLLPLPVGPRPPATTGLVGDTAPDICSRFSALTFSVDNSIPTPVVIRDRLNRIGEKSVNLCVDLSNYVMFTVGQPSHVFDADSVTFPLSVDVAGLPDVLDPVVGGRMDIADDIPVVSDARCIVSAAGVIGGAATAAETSSRRFVLETATYSAAAVRRSSQRLGVRTAASTRYEKELDTQRVDRAVELFVHLLVSAAPGATFAAEQNVINVPTVAVSVKAGLHFLEKRIGLRLPNDEIVRTLTALGFSCSINEEFVQCTAPTWRSTGDICLPHDIVEELARVHGYDTLPSVRPVVALQSVRSLQRTDVKRVVREQLSTHGGLSEVLTYPWGSDRLLAVCAKDLPTVRIEGAPSPEQSQLRPVLIPNLLETVAENLRFRATFGIFEVGEVFAPGRPDDSQSGEGLPITRSMLSIALVGAPGEELFRRAVGLIHMLKRRAHIEELDIAGDTEAPWADEYARVSIRIGSHEIGCIALIRPVVARAAGIDEVTVAGVEMDLSALSVYPSRENRFSGVSDTPEAKFDLSVVVTETEPWSGVKTAALGAHKLVNSVSFLDDYRGSRVSEGHKSLTLRVTLSSPGTTLTAKQIGHARECVATALAESFGASLR